MRSRWTKGGLVIAAGLVATTGALWARQPENAPRGGGMGDIASLGPRLVESLRKAPGCYGAEAGQFQSGKLVIFAWFEDKEAALEWHGGPMHKMTSRMITQGEEINPRPMEHVPDDVPLMLVASASMAPGAEGAPPAMALGIEVYTALAGGLRFEGGSFAPEGFVAVVDKMKAEAAGG